MHTITAHSDHPSSHTRTTTSPSNVNISTSPGNTQHAPAEAMDTPSSSTTRGIPRERGRSARVEVTFTRNEWARIDADTKTTGFSPSHLLKRIYFKRPKLQPLIDREGTQILRQVLNKILDHLSRCSAHLNAGFREGFNTDFTLVCNEITKLMSHMGAFYGNR